MVDGNVQQQYLAAEQAYGEGDFDQAEAIASALLHHLDTTTGSGVEQEACLAWRAFVALLLGHIYFHGLHQTDKAEVHYGLVLASQPPDTLRDLAQQGLERCRDRTPANKAARHQDSAPDDNASLATAAPIDAAQINAATENAQQPTAQNLIRDPFLTSSEPTIATSAPQRSATPWLQLDAITPTAPSTDITPTDTEPTDTNSEALNPDRTTNEAASDRSPQNDLHPEEQVAAVQQPSKQDDVGHSPPSQEPARENNNDDRHATEDLLTEDLLTERAQPAAEALDLSPWLLRRTINFNKR